MYDYNAIGDFMDKLRGSGNEAAAFAMYNGLSGTGDAKNALGGVAGNLDSYLRTRWGDSALKQWVNTNDNKYGAGTLFDPATGKWSGIGQANGQSGNIEGWDPRMFNASGFGAGGVGYKPQGYGSGAGGFDTMPLSDLTKRGGTPGVPFNGGAGSRGAPGSYTGGTYTPGGSNGADGEFTQANGASVTPGTVDPGIAQLIQSLQRDPASGNPFDFYNDEGYKYRLKESQNALENSAASRGQLGSGATLKALQENAQGLASQEYDKAYNRYDQNRKFLEDEYRYTNDDSYKRQLQNLMLNNDNFWKSAGFNNDNFWKSADFNNSNYWKGLGFNEDQRRDARDFDWKKYISDRDYNTDLDKWEKTFGYNAESKDRDRSMTTLMDLVRNGLLGTQGSGNLAGELARLFGGNLMTGAGAGAGGTMGGANTINDLISQIIKYYSNQSLIPK